MHRDGDVFGSAGERAIDGVGVGSRQLRGILAAGAQCRLDLLVAKISESHVIQLQIFATGFREMADGSLVRLGDVGPKLVQVRIDFLRNRRAPAAQMQHGRRRDFDLRSARCHRLQKPEIIHHDGLRTTHFANNRGDGRLFFNAAKLGAFVDSGYHAIQALQEVQMPVGAAEFAIGNAL
jgi:hypothetical protein